MAVERPLQATSTCTEPQETQLMASQVYQDYYMSRGTNDTSSNTGNLEPQDMYETNETGHVDLAKAFETDENQGTPKPGPRHRLAQTDSSVDSEDDLADDNQSLPNPVTSPNNLSPTTPCVAGNKRDRDGNIIDSDNKTPAPDYTAIFPKKTNKKVTDLSQLFQQTQAGSSPGVPDDPRSDPIFQRPSPEHATTRATPKAVLSSPTVSRRYNAQTPVVEPRCLYLPLNESQKRRQQEESSADFLPYSPSKGNDDWDEDSEQRRAAHRRKRERVRNEAMREFAGVTAPAASCKIDRRRKITASETIIGLMPTELDKERREPIVISSDHADSDLGPSDLDSVDEYDELSQSVIPTVLVNKGSSGTGRRGGIRTSKVEHMPRPASSPLPGNHKSVDVSFGNALFPRATQILSRTGLVNNKDTKCQSISHTVAVANSQPEQLVPRPSRPRLPSSIHSYEFISQSQVQLTSSNLKPNCTVTSFDTIPDTSSIPRPPLIKMQTAQDRFSGSPGSSPPVVKKDLESTRTSERPERTNDSITNNSLIDTVGGRLAYQTSQIECLHSSKIGHKNSCTDEDSRDTKQGHQNAELSIPETSPTGSKTQYLDPKNSKSGQEAQCSDIHQSVASQRLEKACPSKPSSGSGLFESAQTQIHISPVKKMSDIGVDASFPAASDDGDIDINVLSAEDVDFQTAMSHSSPSDKKSNKRQKKPGSHRQALREPAKEINALPPQALPLPANLPRSQKLSLGRSSSMKPRPTMDELVENPEELSNIPRRQTKDMLSSRGRDSPPEVAETPQNGKNDSKQRTLTRISFSGDNPSEDAENKAASTSSNESSKSQDRTSVAVSNNFEPSHTGQIVAPNRVFARFRGLNPAYYPATCLGPAKKTNNAYKIRFDDDTVDVLDSGALKRLDIHKGDLVKVDIKGMRTATYQVCGLKNNLDAASDDHDQKSNVKTDVYGHFSLLLESKQRQSLSGSRQKHANDQVEVPISSIYLTTTLWPRLEARKFVYQPSLLPIVLPPQTPSDNHSGISTPSSRSKRISSSHTDIQSFQPYACHSGLFQGMAFATSFSSAKEEERQRVQGLIRDNGGHIFTEGFHQLFEDSLSSEPTTPVKASQSFVPQENPDNIRLVSPASTLGFVALVADTHSRRTKYVQALALNIPCLSSRWVIDSIACGGIIPWAQYLLPAGESSFLDGAIRSRTLYEASNSSSDFVTSAQFVKTIQNRPAFLSKQSIMLVLGRGKDEDRLKTYVFLTRVLGAKRVKCVRDLPTAKTILYENNGATWDWVYVDEGKLEDARAQLLGVKGKRKRDSDYKSKAPALVASIPAAKFKLASEEYVVQSLIMGALMQPTEVKGGQNDVKGASCA